MIDNYLFFASAWAWDISSPLVTSLVGPWQNMFAVNGTVATRDAGPDEEDYEEADFNNCLCTAPAMEHGTGKYAISFRKVGDEAFPLFGVCSDGAPCDTLCSDSDSEVIWLMATQDGALIGNGEFGVLEDAFNGGIEDGQILTMQVRF